MAVAAGAAAPARFASPALRGLISRRVAEIAGLLLAMGGIGMLLALATYNPRDPSLNTATSEPVSNIAGPAGSVLADFLLQGFGLAAVLPPLAMLVWAWRIASRRGVGNPWIRLLCLGCAVPSLAAAFAAAGHSVPFPTSAGLGGAGGHLLETTALDMASGWVGPVGGAMALLLGGLFALLMTAASFGLRWREWRSTARVAGGAARLGAGLAVWGGARVAAAAKAPAPGGALAGQPELSRRVATAARAAPEAPAPARALGKAAAKAKVSMPEKRPHAARQDSLPLMEAGWNFPSLALLAAAPPPSVSGPSEESLQNNARLLESVLGDYGVQGAIREIRPGPVVTLYELEPAPGIRSARVIGLADDIARSLSVAAVRIATVPSRNAIGIEVPNAKRETVYLSELLECEAFVRHPARLPLALGKDISGAPIVADLARMPHLLIAGTTGSGKSVGINAMILSLLYKLPPDECRLILIDPKMLELSVYEGIPHLMAPVVTEPKKAVTALKWVVREMERRYRSMSQLGVRNVGGYNDRVEDARLKGEVISRRVQTGYDSETGKPTFEEQPLTLEKLPFIVVVIDEMADLMMVAGKDIEAAVQRLAQMARAAGIHVVMATQRPSVDVITGTIKANFPTRISFQVISKFDSRTILGEQGAEQLLGSGDMLYMMGGGRITRVHGPFVTDREVEDVVAFLREQGEPAYLDEVTETGDDDSDGTGGFSLPGMADGEVGLYDQAVAIVAREGKASTSFIQRHLQIGYNRAAKLIEQMEKEGVVSTANHVGKREVLVRRTDED
ncbi:MAG TPA: DNA translocase FtsK 4TM domain-containing protein [Acetobacteraceae bacterium]|nr:DNA translocase FtsK 4TM domain-containing protein [Acetobacteraceae bacterium]